jgi:ATP-dependent helicase/nuclease subunit A
MNRMLNIVPAGAGSGKTFKIKTDLTDWVKAGEVKPHRILAVTFTEAAAGELKERIRSALLADGMVEAALDVERAYVSTIHGLGLRIMTEHAFAANASPQPRHLSDGERDLLIRQELAHCEELDAIKAELPRYGYVGKSWAGGTAEDAFRKTLFQTIDLLRGLGEGGTDPALSDEAVMALHELYGEVLDDPEPLRQNLQAAATALLNEFPDGGTPFSGDTAAAQKGFREQLKALRAARDNIDLDKDWKLWTTLSDLRTKARGEKIPDNFVELSEIVIAAASDITRHPGPREDARRNLTGLIIGAQAIMSGYADKKRKAGVIDFADMIVEAEKLLRMKPEILTAIMGDIDCVIVDEFQDTNPVQFALLWRIAQAAPRTLLVGDAKQSIMGFQGADPRLTDELAKQFPGNTTPLDNNWRSDPRIMHFVNDISARMFGENYNPLEAQRPETGHPCLEFVRVSQGRSSKKPNSRPEQHIAARVKVILDGHTIVADRHSNLIDPEMRIVRPGDIAILCQTHLQAARYADRLQEIGIPVRINRKGWLSSPSVIAAKNALAFVADTTDTHAALCLLTLGPRAMPLQEALSALADGVLLDVAELQSLVNLANAAVATPLSILVPQVIAHAGIRDWSNSLPDAIQMRADLLRLEGEVANFEDSHRDMKAAAGFYGQTAPVFLGWLESQRDERNFDRHPDPSSGSIDGVEIITWHASKGREWNIVFVVGLDDKIEEKPGTMRAEFEDFSDLDNVLSKAILRYTPGLPLKDKRDVFIEARRLSAEEEARRLLYVALTRARDYLIIEWPDFKLKKKSEGPGPGNFAEMLVLECELEIHAGQVTVGEAAYPARSLQCTGEPPAEFDASVSVATDVMVGFGELRDMPETEISPWRIRPSQLLAQDATTPRPIESVDLGAPVNVDEDGYGQAALRGTAWHLVFRAVMIRPDLLERACQVTGMESEVANAIEAQAQAMKGWLNGMGYDRFHLELPLQIEESSGAQINAIIDLLAEGDDGFIIVDHKSGLIDDLGAGHSIYRPQLEAYAAALARQFPEKSIQGLAINWMRSGMVTMDFELK